MNTYKPIQDFLIDFMKVALIQALVLTVFAVGAIASDSKGQEILKNKISITAEGKEIRKILSEIEKKARVRFTYSSALVNVNRQISIHYTDSKLSEVLDGIFLPDVTYEVKGNQIILKPAHIGESDAGENLSPTNNSLYELQITGKVTDEGGQPLPGANVLEKGTTNGTTTDAEGSYTLVVANENSVLIVSFIGYASQEVNVGTQTSINITLKPDVTALQEIVVVGYGTQEKVNMTGAVSAVNFDEKITGRALTNVSSGLSGLVPGLAVTQNSGMAGKNSAALMIRGLGTVNNANPLIVVDGMPDVDINRLNVNDIESISVLKDAASAAVYGSRGANGVILITTKSGKGQKKTNITYNGNYAIERPTKAIDFMADYPRALTIHQIARSSSVLRANQQFKDGTIDQWMALGMIDPIRYPNTDVWDIIMRDGVVQNHNLSASGGNDRSNFFASVGFMDEKGLQINNDFKRYNARFNFDYKIRDNINLGARFAGNWSNFVFSLKDGFTDDGSEGANTAGFDLQYSIAGITPYDPNTGYFGGVMAYGEDAQAYNPYTVFVNNLTTQERQEINPNMYIDWSPVKGLVARIDYALNYYNQFRWNAPTPNRAYNFQTGLFGSRFYVGDNAGVSNTTSNGYKTQFNSRLSYNTTLAENHEIGALVVYSEEFWLDRSQASFRTDRLYPTLHEIDAALPGTQTAGGSSSSEGLQSFIGRISYTGFSKYLFEASFRYDGSSKFLPGRQYGFFPSAAVGWRFSEESFMSSLTDRFLSNGKLRASYGSLGNNSGVGRFEQQSTLADAHYMIDGDIAKGLINQKIVNPELTWESTTVMNIGFDLGFLNNRLTAEIDYYDRLTTGMNRPSDLSIFLEGAYVAPRRNIGNLRNRGVEGNFTWRDQIGQLSYTINLNASKNATVLESWNEYLGRGETFIGMPYHFVYTYEDAGIAQSWADVYSATPQGASPGDILRKDLNGDGRITGDDRKAYPKYQADRPTTNFGFMAGASWKGLDFSILFQGARGRKDYWINNYNNVNMGQARYASTWEHWTEPWSLDNRNGNWPRLGGSGGNRETTTFWLDNMNYLRLKNVQLGYRIPEAPLKKIGISSVRIFASGENLITVTKYRGVDPEKAGNANDVYPLNRSIAFGINIGI